MIIKKIGALIFLLFLVLAPCSAATPEELSDAIVDPSTQSYIVEVGSTSGNSTQFAVYNQSLQGFPTNGSSFAVISSGNASGINGTSGPGRNLFVKSGNSTTTGQYSNRGNFSYDIANLYFKIYIPYGAKTLSFDWRFATTEALGAPYWDWARAVLSYGGTSYNMLLLPDGRAVDVNSSGNYSNQISGTIIPNDVVYPYVTGNRLVYGIYTASFDVSAFQGKVVELNFWVADERDGVVDSALFVDNLHIDIENNNVSAGTIPMQKTGIPLGALFLGVITIMGGIYYSKKQ